MLSKEEYEVLKHVYRAKVITKGELLSKMRRNRSKFSLENVIRSLIEKNYVRVLPQVSLNCFVITRQGEVAVEDYES